MKRLMLGLCAFALLTTVFVLVCLAIRPTIWRLINVRSPKGPLSQDEIVAVIEENRGWVEYDEGAPGRPVVSVRLPMGRGGELPSVDILLEYVKGLPHVRRLTLFQTNVTDAGLKEIRALKNLEVLVLSRTFITDAGLENVKSLTKLKYLDLCDTFITGAGFLYLRKLTHLEEVRLSDTNVTDANLNVAPVIECLKGLPSLQHLEIGYNPGVTDSAREELKRALPNVTVD